MEAETCRPVIAPGPDVGCAAAAAGRGAGGRGRVVVLGATGVRGRRIAAVLARDPGVELVLADRDGRRGRDLADMLRARFSPCAPPDELAVARSVAGAAVVVDAAGPFTRRDRGVARASVDAGAHYLDLADERSFVTGVVGLDQAARARGVQVVSGAGVLPAISSAAVLALTADASSVERIEVTLGPGQRSVRGAATVADALWSVGRPLRVWRDGRWTTELGGDDLGSCEFPEPLGTRRVHSRDAPDLELLPAAFAACTVECRVGLEAGLVDRALTRLARLRAPERLAPFARAAAALSTILPGGTRHGGLVVRVVGVDLAGCPLDRRLALVSRHDGPAAACTPALLLIRRLLAAAPATGRAVPCVGLVSWNELIEQLAPLGYSAWRDDGAGWRADHRSAR